MDRFYRWMWSIVLTHRSHNNEQLRRIKLECHVTQHQGTVLYVCVGIYTHRTHLHLARGIVISRLRHTKSHDDACYEEDI